MPRPPYMNGNGNNFKGNKGNVHKKRYEYVPVPSSGAYAILVAMFKAEQSDHIRNMDKQLILNYCNKFSQSSLRDSSKIWSCMKGLIDKSLVGREISRDPVYFLREEGRDLAQKLIATAEGIQLDEEISKDSTNSQMMGSQHALTSSQSNTNPYEPEVIIENGQPTFELKAGTFDIILLIDQRERIAILNPDNTIKMESINLACGDFIWIARPKGLHPSDKSKDLVLDYVVERKRMDDLQSSILDGRYEQQKYRLLNSGIRRPMYLIEDFGQIRQNNMTFSGLQQAVVNMFVQDGIDVERARSPQHSNDFLISMTKCLKKYYLNKDLRSCSQEKLKQKEAAQNEFMPFLEFQVVGAKITNWTVREMFAKHLIQIRGMSDKQVAVILKKYPTIMSLARAYRECASEKDRENLLSKMSIPDSNRTLGPKLSERVCKAYSFAAD